MKDYQLTPWPRTKQFSIPTVIQEPAWRLLRVFGQSLEVLSAELVLVRVFTPSLMAHKIDEQPDSQLDGDGVDSFGLPP